MLRVCLQLASKYLERSLLLFVTSASDLPMRKFCSVVFAVLVDACHKQHLLMHGGLCHKQASTVIVL